MNHNLLFSLLASGNCVEEDCRGVLFTDDMLVLDEAHLVPDVASECFGISLSNFGVKRELKRIYDPRKKRGLITRETLSEYHDREIVTVAMRACDEFFSNAAALYLAERDTVRLSAPDWIESDAPQKLDTLMRLLDTMAMNAKAESLTAELKDYRRRISSIKNSMEDCIFTADKDYVYWLERAGKNKDLIHLKSAPISVSEKLRRALFNRGTSVIMTSATLAINSSMDDFAESVGAENSEFCICTSPFDYDSNMEAILNIDAPEPDKNSRKLDCKALAKNIETACNEIRGGTLVLFTSHSDLRTCAQILESSELLRGRNIYVQGRLPRSETIRSFSEDGNAILLGTDTFWTGIDVPGDALSQVIITRLPFENFTHPLLEARMERAESLGENPFLKISLPAAIIKFRQGIGRLIRSSTDKGRIVILDSRIVSKGYGKNFVSAIPSKNTRRFSTARATKKSTPEREYSPTDEDNFPF